MSDKHPGPWQKSYRGGTHDGMWSVVDATNRLVVRDVGEGRCDYLVQLKSERDALLEACEQEAKQYEGEDAWLSTALSRVARHVKPKDVEETRTVPFDEPEGGDE